MFPVPEVPSSLFFAWLQMFIHWLLPLIFSNNSVTSISEYFTFWLYKIKRPLWMRLYSRVSSIGWVQHFSWKIRFWNQGETFVRCCLMLVRHVHIDLDPSFSIWSSRATNWTRDKYYSECHSSNIVCATLDMNHTICYTVIKVWHTKHYIGFFCSVPNWFLVC